MARKRTKRRTINGLLAGLRSARSKNMLRPRTVEEFLARKRGEAFPALKRYASSEMNLYPNPTEMEAEWEGELRERNGAVVHGRRLPHAHIEGLGLVGYRTLRGRSCGARGALQQCFPGGHKTQRRGLCTYRKFRGAKRYFKCCCARSKKRARVQANRWYVPRAGHLDGWSEDAQKAITENPRYFVWWYSVKSLALVATLGALAYYVGKSR